MPTCDSRKSHSGDYQATVFWDVTSSSLVDMCRRFRVTCFKQVSSRIRSHIPKGNRCGFLQNTEAGLNLNVVGLYKHPVTAAQLICDIMNFAVAGTRPNLLRSSSIKHEHDLTRTQIPTACHRPMQVILSLFTHCESAVRSSVLLSTDISRKLLPHEMCPCFLVKRWANL